MGTQDQQNEGGLYAYAWVKNALSPVLVSVFFLLTVLGSPAVLATPQPQDASRSRSPLVVVRALGKMDADILRLACRSLLESMPLRCEIRASEPEAAYEDQWDQARHQFDARGLLERSFRRDRSKDAHVELLLTDLDIFEGDRPYVFGLGSLTDRVAVISIARLQEKKQTRAQLFSRIVKLVLHEVGHTMGLPHDANRHCVMRTDPTVSSLDTAPPTLCERCHQRLASAADKIAGPGQIQLGRARGLLVRGELDAARHASLLLLKGANADEALLYDLGEMFLRAGENGDAIALLRRTLNKDPQSARAHVSLGLAFKRRGLGSDLEAAVYHFEQAVELQPRWKRVHAYALQLRDDLARAQGPAS